MSKYHPFKKWSVEARRQNGKCWTAWAKTNDYDLAVKHYELVIKLGHMARVLEYDEKLPDEYKVIMVGGKNDF